MAVALAEALDKELTDYAARRVMPLMYSACTLDHQGIAILHHIYEGWWRAGQW